MEKYRFGEFELDLERIRAAAQRRARQARAPAVRPARRARQDSRAGWCRERKSSRRCGRRKSSSTSTPGSIRSCAKRARRSAIPRRNRTFIETVPGRGYRFVAQVTAVTKPVERRPKPRPLSGAARRVAHTGRGACHPRPSRHGRCCSCSPGGPSHGSTRPAARADANRGVAVREPHGRRRARLPRCGAGRGYEHLARPQVDLDRVRVIGAAASASEVPRRRSPRSVAVSASTTSC